MTVLFHENGDSDQVHGTDTEQTNLYQFRQIDNCYHKSLHP